MLDSHRSLAKEQSLIETINIVSKDNIFLKKQVETLNQRLAKDLDNLVSRPFYTLS